MSKNLDKVMSELTVVKEKLQDCMKEKFEVDNLVKHIIWGPETGKTRFIKKEDWDEYMKDEAYQANAN